MTFKINDFNGISISMFKLCSYLDTFLKFHFNKFNEIYEIFIFKQHH